VGLLATLCTGRVASVHLVVENHRLVLYGMELALLTNGRLQLREVSGAANHDAPWHTSRDGTRKDGERRAGDFLVLGRIPGWEALGTSSHLAVTHQHRPCNRRVHHRVSRRW
jgi:hypothetical protein